MKEKMQKVINWATRTGVGPVVSISEKLADLMIKCGMAVEAGE